MFHRIANTIVIASSLLFQGCDNGGASKNLRPSVVKELPRDEPKTYNHEKLSRKLLEIETEHPDNSEQYLLDFLQSMESANFDDILLFKDTIKKIQLTGNLRREILIQLTKRNPQRAFDLTYAEGGDNLSGVMGTWLDMAKPEQYAEIFAYVLQSKFDSKKVSATVRNFSMEYAQRTPSEFISQLKGLKSHPLFNALVKANAWTMTWASPQETLTLLEQMTDPVLQADATATYGAGILRRANTPQWKNEIYSLQDISDPKLRSAAFAGAYGSMLEKDFQGAIKIIENIQDQGAYDKIVTDNVSLLDKKMSRDEVLALIYKVQDPAAIAKLEEFTGLKLSQQK